MNKHLKLAISILIPVTVLLMPTSWIPVDNLTLTEHRVIALFVLAAVFWILEPIPIYTTSVLVIVLELLLVSDYGLLSKKGILSEKGYAFFAYNPEMGKTVSYKAILASFSSPVIMLFLGGFFLAMAATKYKLDRNLARVLLKPFGHKPSVLLIGIMLITALFSMFMSNTATTAMMLAIVAPLLAMFDLKDKGRIAFALAIPVAANIGGIGTPIGTPPNAIGVEALERSDAAATAAGKVVEHANAIDFGTWMFFAVPFVVVLLAFSWLLLKWFFPPDCEKLDIEMEGDFERSPKAIVVYVVFACTILLWLTQKLHGINSNIVAMIPVGVFSICGIINRDDLKKISWDVLWLVAGGIALGVAMKATGLSKNVIASIPFDKWSAIAIILAASVITLLMANFMSHTATANLLMPVMAALGVSLPTLIPLGGVRALILAVVFAASLGMSLPISTPPNALAYATGAFKTSDMAKVGIIVGLVGLALTFGMLFLLKQVGFLH